MGGAAVIADDPQHAVSIGSIVRERALLARHFRRGRVTHAGHDRGDGATNRATFITVIGNAGGHQIAADIGVAETQGAIFI